ncbi:MAG: DNA-binding protein [Acidimicrobiales bacterium]|nr:DNA-binding protein [Acidimicrobiales bacterium]
MNLGKPVKRAYDTTGRRQQAESTRLRIIRAAADLFVERGYGPTSVDAVAEAAGVSRATVFNAVGGKAALVRAAYNVAIVGDDDPVPLPDRPWARPVREATDGATMLTRYAHMVTVIDGRVAGIWEVMRGAAGAHPEVREHWDEIREERAVGAANVIRMLQERGGRLPDGLSTKMAADVVLMLIDPGLYHLLVEERSWRPAAFERWLAQTLRSQLLC